jgi:hypothetical protein
MSLFLAAVLNDAKNTAAWAISFFAKPPGSYIGAVALTLILLWGVHRHGYGAGRAACESAHATKVEQAVRAQVKAAAAVVARSDALASKNAEADRKAREIIRYVAIEAKAEPGAADECIPATLADRLRDLD